MTQEVSTLFTKALDEKQVRYILSLPDAILLPQQRKWKSLITENLDKYSYILSVQELENTGNGFYRVDAPAPVEKLYDEALSKLTAIYYQEEIEKFVQENRKLGKSGFENIRDFTESLRIKTAAAPPELIDYGTFSRDEYQSKNVKRSKFYVDVLDAVTHGFLSGDVATLFASYKGGKTTMLNFYTKQAYMAGENLLYICMESSPVVFAAQMDAQLAHFNPSLFRLGIDERTTEKLKILETSLRKRENNLVIAPRINHPSQIVDILQSLPFKIDRVAIDGIHLLGGFDAKDSSSMYTGLTNASRQLKSIAMKQNVAIMTVAQANRQGAAQDGTPEAHQIGSAIAIAQDTDILIATKFMKLMGMSGILSRLVLNRHGAAGRSFFTHIDYNTYKTKIFGIKNDDLTGDDIASGDVPLDNGKDVTTILEELKDFGLDADEGLVKTLSNFSND